MGERGPAPDTRRRALSQNFIGRVRRYMADRCQAQYRLAIEIDMHPDTLSRFLSGKLTAIPGHPKLEKLAQVVRFYGPILEVDHEQSNQMPHQRGTKRNQDQSGGAVPGRTAAAVGRPTNRRSGNFGPGQNRSRVSSGGKKI